jgi:hypothetical protein
MLQGSNKSIEFFVIGRILSAGFIELFTKTGITINFKYFGKIWKYEDWCLCDLLLEKFKALLGFFRPLERSSLKAFCYGSNNGAEAIDEALVE